MEPISKPTLKQAVAFLVAMKLDDETPMHYHLEALFGYGSVDSARPFLRGYTGETFTPDTSVGSSYYTNFRDERGQLLAICAYLKSVFEVLSENVEAGFREEERKAALLSENEMRLKELRKTDPETYQKEIGATADDLPF